ncbi:sensor histidine kinase [Streptomyces sp. NPDC085540]|uniref:sensor histidine kinase n=1 Tax=Streptomyces sp. NPDC085540 TaxID=3365730 RepID=UPI0037D90EE5
MVGVGAGAGVQRARRFMVLATGLNRTSHLAVAAVAAARLPDPAAGPVGPTGPGVLTASWTMFGLAVASSAALYGTAYTRGRFRRRWVWADVLVMGCALPWLALWWVGGTAASAHGWVVLLGGSASAAAAAGLGRRGCAAAVLLLLATSVAVRLGAPDGGAAVLPGHLNAVATSVLLAGVLSWYLEREGALLDSAQHRAVTAEAERARQAERTAHHAALHDTVLATLTAIASGRVDAGAGPVRERCAREAAYLRRLVQYDGADGGTVGGAGGAADAPGRLPADAGRSASGGLPAPAVSLGAALEDAVRSAECLGLEVTARYHSLPAVPGEAAAALAAAVTEALNNVRVHAGTGRAYLTAVGRDGGVAVTVVDRGAGFDAGAGPDAGAGARELGTGLRRSVYGRMAAAGGRAGVESVPGEGTRVDLCWPA